MRIEKIELIGFKSFADKMSFQFHPGITGIVGPNGCGKSNIVDAFRWVLGEQSAKSLRGEKMEEVIFNGSSSKKPKGMAEVTMTLSGLEVSEQKDGKNGSNGDGPSDSVTVTRRLYRSGESEYMINKRQCRLKDIRDLFLDTGLEVRSYSILEQDRISQILNAKPAERRFLIEEVAGVMKYNVRKKEALSKLESSRGNLQRIQDIITEVKKQISFFDRLAKKAERYKKLTSELHSIEVKISKRDYEILRRSLDGILSEYGAVKEQESLQKAALSTIETDTERQRLELLEKEKFLEQIQEKFQLVEREISEFEKRLAVAATEKENFKEYLLRLRQQTEEFLNKEEVLHQRLSELEKEEADLRADIETQREILSDRSESVRSLEDEISEHDDIIERKRRELFRTSEELSNLKNTHAKLQQQFENLEHKEESGRKDAENAKIMLEELDSSVREVESNLQQKNNQILLLNEKRAVLTEEVSVVRASIETLRNSLATAREELASYVSRIESLRELVFDGSAREILAQQPHFSLLESISDIIEVEDEYEKAIESALSEKVNGLIVDSQEHIVTAIESLREKGAGRTVFIPIQAPRTRTALSVSSASVPESCLGSAVTFVKTKESFSPIVTGILGKYMIVKDIGTALLSCQKGSEYTYVTLEGDIVEPCGAVTTGEIKGVLRRKREIRELEGEIETRRGKIERFQRELNDAQESLVAREADLSTCQGTIVSTEKDLSLLKLTVENYREERERRSRKLAYLSLEIEQTSAEKESIDRLLMEKDGEIKAIDTRRIESEQHNQSLLEEMSVKRARLEEHRSEVTDVRLSITSLSGRLDSAEKEKEGIAREIAESGQKKSFLAEEISTVQSRINQRDEDINADEEKIKALIVVADAQKKEILERKEIIDAENQGLLVAEHSMKNLRNEVQVLSRRAAEYDVQKAEHSLKMETLFEHVRQNYGLALDVDEVEPMKEEDEARLGELKEKIAELGPVNLGTIDEYEELQKRFEFLRGQQEDLNKSIAELEEAITRINVTTRKKLRDAFDALRIKFGEVFTALFGGGKAEIIMTDENNILETGIDIIAQPPGKRLQNINLLSGGEKTLTALSLLFSSFLLKPTPLCILDEADSALDEMNTGKFANLVKDFSKETQFIVVTHNRNTMSAADYLYGITMEEAGVSKVISMQLVEAA